MAPSPLTLDDLIRFVRETSASNEPLEQLATAMTTQADTDQVTDALLGHFVDQARKAGCSWSQIGGALGVTKQAAQQRFVASTPVSLERFTQRVRNVLRVHAQTVARRLHHNYVGTEHLLLGLFGEREGLAAKALVALGADEDELRSRIETVVGQGRNEPSVEQPFTPRAVRSLELAVREALELGHNYVGTEHVLLGLLAEGEGVAAQVLSAAGVEKAAARAEIVRLLSGYTPTS